MKDYLQKQGLRVEEVNHPYYGKYLVWNPNNRHSCLHPIRTDKLETLKRKPGRRRKDVNDDLFTDTL